MSLLLKNYVRFSDGTGPEVWVTFYDSMRLDDDLWLYGTSFVAPTDRIFKGETVYERIDPNKVHPA